MGHVSLTLKVIKLQKKPKLPKTNQNQLQKKSNGVPSECDKKIVQQQITGLPKYTY